jgi:cell division protein FtsB
LAVSDELSEVKKGLSKTQKAFEGLAYQSATVREQLESENKTLSKEREALELLVKKFNANLADLENLTKTLSQEVRSGIKSASKALSNEISARG